MAQQGGNQNIPPSNLCRMGCGFYGNPMYDGMCSKCHKDVVKRRQQTSSPTQLATGRISPLVCSSAVSEREKPEPGSPMLSPRLTPRASPITSPMMSPLPVITSIETALPTVNSPLVGDKAKQDTDKEQDSEDTTACSSAESSPSEPERKPKKNRCHTCKKKLGLTGFPCRCGGLYCGMHRYSDKHDCSFNYKELAQVEIRKCNPVIIAEKVQKI